VLQPGSMEVVRVPSDFELEKERVWFDQILEQGPRGGLPVAAGMVCQACGELGFCETVDERTAAYSQCGGDCLAFSAGHEECGAGTASHVVSHRWWRYCEVCRDKVEVRHDTRCGHFWLCIGCEQRIVTAGHTPGAVVGDLGLRRWTIRDRLDRTGTFVTVGDSHDGLDVPRVPALAGRLPAGLEPCPGCGQVRGATKRPGDSGGVSASKSTCLCEGLVCGECGRRRMRRPISDYFDAEDGRWWHVPYFAAMGGRCPHCT